MLSFLLSLLYLIDFGETTKFFLFFICVGIHDWVLKSSFPFKGFVKGFLNLVKRLKTSEELHNYTVRIWLFCMCCLPLKGQKALNFILMSAEGMTFQEQ